MNIGIVTNLMDSNGSGIGRYTRNLVENLLKIDKKNKYYLIHSNKKSYNFTGNYQEIRLPFFDSIPKKLIIGTFIFEKICRDYKLNILHDLGQISPFFFKTKTIKILTVHDLAILKFPHYFSAYANIYSKFFKIALRNTDEIITISKNSKKDIKQSFGILDDKISVIYEGVSKEFTVISDKKVLLNVKKKYDLPDKFILFVGTIEPRKNLPLLIRVFSRVKSNGLKLVIVGEMGWKYQEVFETINRLKIKKDVKFTGFVDDKDLPLIYNLAEAFVYPSSYEGFGLPVLEAMACGCPVISSNNSSLPEIAGGAAILINPTKEIELATALKETIVNKQIKQNLIKKGLIQAKKFNWRKCAEETLKVYENI